MTLFQPADAAEIAGVVTWAAANATGLEIVAGGSKRTLGRPMDAPHVLDVSRLSGIVDYDPAELVLTARAATPMAEIAAALDAGRQMLAFEPPDWRSMLRGAAQADADGLPDQTLGGVLACNLAGPRRVRAGAARDHLIGFAAVNGFGDIWKAGGRVVKNVTGFDMCKLQCGAYGTLSVLTEVSVRVMPRPETVATVVLCGLDDAAGIAVLSAALNTPHEVSAAAHLPACAARRSSVAAIAAIDGPVTALRLEGPLPSVVYRAAQLASFGGVQLQLDAIETALFWSEIASVCPLLDISGCNLWRICPTPAAAPVVLHAIRARLAAAQAFYDWGGGLLWLAVDAAEAGADGGAAIVRAAVRGAGGHATLVVAAPALREAVPVFEPAPPALAALARRVKTGFDPGHVLNPGRMQPER